MIAAKASRGQWYLKKWADKYLKNAQKRLQRHMHGLELTIDDVYVMQQLCPYEVCVVNWSECISSYKVNLRVVLDCCAGLFQILRTVH